MACYEIKNSVTGSVLLKIGQVAVMTCLSVASRLPLEAVEKQKACSPFLLSARKKHEQKVVKCRECCYHARKSLD
jgi:hypothetical protein